jgi:3-methyl-2-oxobutanoate hydroxymethyltransferase
VEIVHRLTQLGIPVMAHLGLTPQFVHQMGGFKVQGKTADAAARIVADAHELQEAGAFSLVLEGVPSELARAVTSQLRIPTIGIGAGPHCDGQVLVVHDMLGLTERQPRFVKRYAELGALIVEAAKRYARDVEEGAFPDGEHSYSLPQEARRSG